MVETREFSLENLMHGHSSHEDVLRGWIRGESHGKVEASSASQWKREPVHMNDHAASIDRSLTQELQGVRKRLVSRMFATWAAAAWCFQAYIMWVFADSLSTPLHRTLCTILILAAALIVIVVGLLLRRWSVGYFRSETAVARSLEGHFPELDSRLYALNQARDPPRQKHTPTDEPQAPVKPNIVKRDQLRLT